MKQREQWINYDAILTEYDMRLRLVRQTSRDEAQIERVDLFLDMVHEAQDLLKRKNELGKQIIKKKFSIRKEDKEGLDNMGEAWNLAEAAIKRVVNNEEIKALVLLRDE